MRQTLGRALLLPIVLLVLVVLKAGTFAVADPLDDAASAYRRKDYKTAVEIWRKLASQGNPIAELKMGQSYLVGLSVPKDPRAGVTWLRQSAAQGNAQAESWLGDCYRAGEGVSLDLGIAAQWYQKAADQGEPAAMSSLGRAYLYGSGVPRDLVQADKWLELAIKRSDAHWITWFSKFDLEKVQAQITDQQLAEARTLIAEWRPR